MNRRASPPPLTAPIPPQNLEAEESVLGAALISPNAIAACREVLDPGDFYRESHTHIWRAICALADEGHPVDAITVTDRLEETPAPAYRPGGSMLDAVGGRVRVHELAALVPATANAAHHARIVRAHSTLRGLIRTGGEIARLGWERGDDVAVAIEEAQELVFALSVGRGGSDFATASEVVGAVWTRLTELAESGAAVIGCPSGFGHLDALTAGFQPGELTVLASRPSMGKSALALAIIAHVAVGRGEPVALFTLEMSRSVVVQRLLSVVATVDSQKIRTGRGLDLEDWSRLNAASSKINAAPLLINDSPAVTVGDIRAKARKLKLRQPDLALVVVDYLQLMTTGASEEGRVQEVAKISRALKVLAGELEVPVIAISQLSRAVEQRHDKRPMLSDLRESGAIEQDADLVCFLYRDEYYNPEDSDQQGVAEVNIAKQRNGPTGTVKLSFVKKFARFSDLPHPGSGA